MKALAVLAPILAGLVVALTYFLVQGTSDEPLRHDRGDALQAVALHDAAVQRTVLLARAGLLASYDPLVRSMGDLVEAAADLPATAEVATGAARADIEHKAADVVRAVRDQEALVEAFKSDNALLRNSLSYFNHLSGRLASGADGATGLEAEIGMLTNAMLRFTNAPGQVTIREVTASLDRLERLADDPAIRSLVAHGRLVATTLPRVDDLLARIQAAPVSRLTGTLQDAYLAAQARAVGRADVFMALIYVAALALVVYIAVLFARLRANARVLRTRLDFERLIASISSQFINLAHSDIRAAVGKGLVELAGHARAAGARIIIFRGAEADSAASFSFSRDSPDVEICDERMLELIRHWTARGYERQGCLQIADVEALPEGEEKAALRSAGIRSWVCIPMRVAGKCLGVLVLYHAEPQPRREDDIALLRTAAEIFASAIARDTSEGEREELEAQLNRSQRLEAIGTLAGGIAHEFNNVLGAVRGYSEMALGALVEDTRARRYVLQIMKAGERAQDIVEQVLAFGRRRQREHRPLAAEPVVGEAVDLVRASLPATVSLRVRMKAKAAMLVGDATELQQIVMNLATNAAQAMDGRGVLEIVLDTITARRTLGLSHGSLPTRRYVRLTVRDSGHGIDRETMERMFEPFFTTKPAGQGTGLGLSSVHGIVNAHQGAIDVKSRPGKGTSVSVYFPEIEEDVRQEEDVEPQVRRGKGETVLIVDDHEPLVTLGEEMLAALGYEPVGFRAGRAALAAFRADPGRFDLVLTDEVMPEMTGTELAGAIHEMRPNLPIVLMTGHGRTLQPDRLQAAGISEVLRKPLLSRPLADCLSRQLASAGPISPVTNRSLSEINR